MEQFNRLDELEGVAKSSSKGGEGAAEKPYATVTKQTAQKKPRAKPHANAHRKTGRNANQMEQFNRLDEVEGVAKSSSKGGEGAAEKPYIMLRSIWIYSHVLLYFSSR
jgi:hypothetical protein